MRSEGGASRSLVRVLAVAALVLGDARERLLDVLPAACSNKNKGERRKKEGVQIGTVGDPAWCEIRPAARSNTCTISCEVNRSRPPACFADSANVAHDPEGRRGSPGGDSEARRAHARNAGLGIQEMRADDRPDIPAHVALPQELHVTRLHILNVREGEKMLFQMVGVRSVLSSGHPHTPLPL